MVAVLNILAAGGLGLPAKATADAKKKATKPIRFIGRMLWQVDFVV
jgi:hypothetical protein